MVEWSEASDDVLEIAQELIDKYHPELVDARIGFMMRSVAPKSNGKVTLGKCRKVSEQDQVYIPYDFVIWLAADYWDSRLTAAQRVALADHELCHAMLEYDEDGNPKARIVKHDVEEFDCIIARHGFWWPNAETTEEAMQQAKLPLENAEHRRGRVESVKEEYIRNLGAIGAKLTSAQHIEPEPIHDDGMAA